MKPLPLLEQMIDQRTSLEDELAKASKRKLESNDRLQRILEKGVVSTIRSRPPGGSKG